VARIERYDDRDEPRRPAPSGAGTILLVVLAVAGAGLLLLCGGGAAMWLFMARTEVRQQEMIREDVARLEEKRAEQAKEPTVTRPADPGEQAPAGSAKPEVDAGPMKLSRDNLRRIGLAAHNYDSSYGIFPNNVYSPDGKPLLSWRVQLLAYLEEENLYRVFKHDEPWDSEHNMKLIARMPKVYAPVRGKAEPGKTYYRGFAGPGTMFEPRTKIAVFGIHDGAAHTAWVVEAGEPVIWTKPDDLPFDPMKDLPKLGGLFDGDFHVLTVDAQVHLIRKDFDPETFRAMVTRSGGEIIDLKMLKK
jgi:hypothetical protein